MTISLNDLQWQKVGMIHATDSHTQNSAQHLSCIATATNTSASGRSITVIDQSQLTQTL